MAHAICVPEADARGLNIRVFSAGIMDFTDTPPAVPTWITCCQNSTPPQKDGSTFVRNLPLDSIDRFLVMEREHANTLITEYNISPLRVSLLSEFDSDSKNTEIDDPMNLGPVEFERCYARIRKCILRYLDLTSELTVKTEQGAAANP
jgi:protein-tyrosine-phosphatase